MTVESAISALSPKHWYKLDETSGTTATDSGSGGVNGTYNGSPTLARTKAGAPDGNNFADFDGTDDYVSIGTVSTFNFLHKDQDSTLAFFFAFDDHTADALQCHFSNNEITSTNVGVSAVYDNRSAGPGSPAIRFYATNGTSAQASTAGSYIYDSNWHFIAFRKEGLSVRSYIDGERVANTFAHKWYGASTADANNALKLGNAGTYWLDGMLAHFVAWDSLKTEEEILSIYREFAGGSATLSLTLVDNTGAAIADQTNLSWWYFGNKTPDDVQLSQPKPDASGIGASSNGSGVFSVTTVTGLNIAASQTGLIAVEGNNFFGAFPVTLS